jgi:hypothetical protein
MVEIGRKSLENTARAALDLRGGRALTDAEWARARTSLIEFVTILRRWEAHVEAADSVSALPLAA